MTRTSPLTDGGSDDTRIQTIRFLVLFFCPSEGHTLLISDHLTEEVGERLLTKHGVTHVNSDAITRNKIPDTEYDLIILDGIEQFQARDIMSLVRENRPLNDALMMGASIIGMEATGGRSPSPLLLARRLFDASIRRFYDAGGRKHSILRRKHFIPHPAPFDLVHMISCQPPAIATHMLRRRALPFSFPGITKNLPKWILIRAGIDCLVAPYSITWIQSKDQAPAVSSETEQSDDRSPKPMIDHLFSILYHRGLTRSPAAMNINFNISFLRGILVQVFDHECQSSTIIKIAMKNGMEATSNTLAREYAILNSIHDTYKGLAPDALFLEKASDYAILAQKGIPHTHTDLQGLFQEQVPNHHIFKAFLAGVGRSTPPSSPESGWHAFQESLGGLPTDLRIRLQQTGRDREWEELIAGLPHIPQHCDLTLNNVGVREDNGAIVFFDWEDYGQSDIPGLDIASLISSGCNFNPAFVEQWIERAMTDKQSAAHHTLLALCRSCDIDMSRITDLFLLGLIVFHGLKKRLEYADFVLENIKRLIQTLSLSGRFLKDNRENSNI